MERNEIVSKLRVHPRWCVALESTERRGVLSRL